MEMKVPVAAQAAAAVLPGRFFSAFTTGFFKHGNEDCFPDFEIEEIYFDPGTSVLFKLAEFFHNL